MYFDLDDIFFSSRVLDILLLVFILFLSAVSASITHYVLRWYMVRPSESICHALKSCAAWIDDDGSLIRGGGSSQLTMGPASARTPTVARSKVLPEAYSTTSLWSKGASGDAKEPVTLVRAMQRFLAHLQASMRLHDTGLHLPGLKATHEGQPDTRPGTVAPEEGSDGESSTMGRWRGGALQRGLSQPDKRASTRFDPKVINRMGSMAWSALDMGEEVLVAACHAIFMKVRLCGCAALRLGGLGVA